MSILNNEITTPRQAKNGTRAFLCKRTGSVYTSYKSGYVRRKAPGIRIYQLNKKSVIRSVSWCNWSNWSNGMEYKVTRRIMILDEAKRLELIEKLSENYVPSYEKAGFSRRYLK